MTASWEQVESELDAARHWQAEGNHGRARVCARRAAGWAVGMIHPHPGGTSPDGNAYHRLLLFQEMETTPDELRTAAARLTTRVSENHTLPFDEDPIADAEAIVRALQATSTDAGEGS